MVKNKYRSTLTNAHLRQHLCLALTPFMPKFKELVAQKRCHLSHLLCIVRTFLLELCFGILTVTVPDSRLNGNLASGPFGFLIEYPCFRLSSQNMAVKYYIKKKKVKKFTICVV